MCGALPKEFDKNYWDVRVVIPDYSCIPEQYRNNFEYVTHFYMSSGPYVQDKYVGVLKYEQDGITYYIIVSVIEAFILWLYCNNLFKARYKNFTALLLTLVIYVLLITVCMLNNPADN